MEQTINEERLGKIYRLVHNNTPPETYSEALKEVGVIMANLIEICSSQEQRIIQLENQIKKS